jgi:hypothetical protein
MGNADFYISIFFISLFGSLLLIALLFNFYLSYKKDDIKAEAYLIIDSLSSHDNMWERSSIIELVEKYCRVKYDFFCEFPPEQINFWNAPNFEKNFEKCPLEILDEKLTSLKSKPHIFEYNSNNDSIFLSRLCLPKLVDIFSVYIFNEPNKDDFCVVSAWYEENLYFLSGRTYARQHHYFLCRKQKNTWLVEEINYNRKMAIENHVKHPDLVNLILKRNRNKFLNYSILLIAIPLIFALLLQNGYLIVVGLFIGILILISRWVYIFTMKFFFKNDKNLYNWERIYKLP